MPIFRAISHLRPEIQIFTVAILEFKMAAKESISHCKLLDNQTQNVEMFMRANFQRHRSSTARDTDILGGHIGTQNGGHDIYQIL